MGIRIAIGFIALGTANLSLAQGRFSGEIETFFSAMKFKGPFVGRERGTRLTGVYDTGPWSFQLSYFLYAVRISRDWRVWHHLSGR